VLDYPRGDLPLSGPIASKRAWDRFELFSRGRGKRPTPSRAKIDYPSTRAAAEAREQRSTGDLGAQGLTEELSSAALDGGLPPTGGPVVIGI